MFTLERGVSVLSPVLFLLIMDPLLKSLQSKGLGPSISGTYAGGFIHADDIRTISSSRATLQEQIDTVHAFAADNGLTLNPTNFFFMPCHCIWLECKYGIWYLVFCMYTACISLESTIIFMVSDQFSETFCAEARTRHAV